MLRVVTFHYIRDVEHSSFPRLHALAIKKFERQLDFLCAKYQVVSCERALAYLKGESISDKDPCLLTFDDGLKEHVTTVLPRLIERKLSGVFALVTKALAEGWVISAHKNHFLLASLDLEVYRKKYLDRLLQRNPRISVECEASKVSQTYRWDEPKVAAFKYLVNFITPAIDRDQIIDEIFSEMLGDSRVFAQELYMSWNEVRTLQQAGMTIAGHSHNHIAMTQLGDMLAADIATCKELLIQNLATQRIWPFVYPFGKSTTFDGGTASALAQVGFHCAFSTVSGANQPGVDVYAIKRFDTNEIEAA